jgi:hypothetical protein
VKYRLTYTERAIKDIRKLELKVCVCFPDRLFPEKTREIREIRAKKIEKNSSSPNPITTIRKA